MTNGNQNQCGLERELNNPFQKLREAVGQKVKMDYVSFGSLLSFEGTIINVEQLSDGSPHGCVQTTGGSAPFLGWNEAIQKITNEKGDVLYEIPDDYSHHYRILKERP